MTQPYIVVNSFEIDDKNNDIVEVNINLRMSVELINDLIAMTKNGIHDRTKEFLVSFGYDIFKELKKSLDLKDVSNIK